MNRSDEVRKSEGTISSPLTTLLMIFKEKGISVVDIYISTRHDNFWSNLVAFFYHII